MFLNSLCSCTMNQLHIYYNGKYILPFIIIVIVILLLLIIIAIIALTGNFHLALTGNF